MSTITAQIQLRRDTSTNWTANNPVLLAGEMALSTDVLYTGTDQPRYKIGNGVDTWLNLDYVPEGGGGNSYPENLFLTVVNKTGDNLLATGYKVLKVQTAQGQRLAVDYALADSNGNSVDTIGVVSENINNNQTGKIIVIGEITGLNTTGSLQGETWTDGDVLYVSSTTPGNLTNVQPTAPNHLVVVGYVVYAHANQGKIYCKVMNGWEIGELHDVYAPSPTHNQGIFWSSGTTRYENKSVTDVLGYTPPQFNSVYFQLGNTGATTFSPADATTYYYGMLTSATSTATNNQARSVIMPVNTTVTDVSVSCWVNSTIGSNEAVELYLEEIAPVGTVIKSTLLTNSFLMSSANRQNNAVINGLNFLISSGNCLTIKMVCPTWVTNPTNMWITFMINAKL